MAVSPETSATKASQEDGATPHLPACLTLCDGRMMILDFEEATPVAFRKRRAGGVLRVRQGEREILGVIIPSGFATRSVVRALSDTTGMEVGEQVIVSRQAQDQNPGYDFADEQAVHTLTAWPEPELDFSVVTLVRDWSRYRRMLSSYHEMGFTPNNTEFVALDNTKANTFEGYGAARRLTDITKGKYIIYCHDDVELVSADFDALLGQLTDLERSDPHWMIAGVAGGVYHSKKAHRKRKVHSRVSDRFGISVKMPEMTFPCKVESLDECFLLMPRDRVPQSSLDLSGFHFFGTDLCLQAELAGGSAYVIDFHTIHHGHGRTDQNFLDLHAELEEKYAHFFPGRTVTTTTRRLDLEYPTPSYPVLRPVGAYEN